MLVAIGGGGAQLCGYADTSARRVYVIGSGSAVRVTPAPSGFNFLFFIFLHLSQKDEKKMGEKNEFLCFSLKLN